jgi:hypothetical protein
MVFPCALGRWSWWLVPAETIPMAHEVMGAVVSPDAITMTAPAGRKYVALAGCKQWNFRFSIGSPPYALDVPTTLSARCGENLRGSCTKFFAGAFPSCLRLVFLARCCPHHAPHSPLAVGRSPSSSSVCSNRQDSRCASRQGVCWLSLPHKKGCSPDLPLGVQVPSASRAENRVL